MDPSLACWFTPDLDYLYKGHMPEVRPFVGLLYDPATAGSVATLVAPPYDVISPADQDRFYRASPNNVIRLILGRSKPGDDGSKNQYTRAASYLRAWRAGGILRATPEASVYPYEWTFRVEGRRRRVRGVVAEVGLEEWGGSIVPHERTFSGALEDRLRLIRAVRANLSPVYTIAPGPVAGMSEYLDAATDRPARAEFSDESGTLHRLWVTSRHTERLSAALAGQPLMIADGHHRYSVALAYREEMRARFGPGPWDGMMMLIVDAGTEDPPVLPIHRLASGLEAGLRIQAERVRDMAEILATVSDDALTYGVIRLEGSEVVHEVGRLRGRPPTVCALHEQILDREKGLKLRFIPDAVAAEEAVLRGEAAVALLLPATRVDRVWRVVRAGQKLPQKSTYFWPKPRTGMVLRPFE